MAGVYRFNGNWAVNTDFNRVPPLLQAISSIHAVGITHDDLHQTASSGERMTHWFIIDSRRVGMARDEIPVEKRCPP